MTDRITPPILSGTDGEKLSQLIEWCFKLCEKLNISIDELDGRRISFPILSGTDGEKLSQLVTWIHELCGQLNASFAGVLEKRIAPPILIGKGDTLKSIILWVYELCEYLYIALDEVALLSATKKKLVAPFIYLSSKYIVITSSGSIPRSFDIFVDGTVKFTTFDNVVSISALELPEGTYKITVIARARGYSDSDESNVLYYTNLPDGLSGLWEFSENINGLTGMNGHAEKINFTYSYNGRSYNGTEIAIWDSEIYYEHTEGSDGHIVMSDGEWAEGTQTIYLGDTAQAVTSEFYDWFCSNASQLIIFFVSGVYCQAVKGSTFSEWVNSKRNRWGLWINSDGVVCYKENRPLLDASGAIVRGGRVIAEGGNYNIK